MLGWVSFSVPTSFTVSTPEPGPSPELSVNVKNSLLGNKIVPPLGVKIRLELKLDPDGANFPPESVTLFSGTPSALLAA